MNISEKNLSEAANLAIYRLVQEALTNISRHANASIVTIEIKADMQHEKMGILIKINDNGVGFNPSNNDGFGLPGMRERVEGLGGTLSINSSLAHGSALTAWIPLSAWASL